MSSATSLQSLGDLLGRYGRVLAAAWASRRDLDPKVRNPLERQFLPAALEILETPAPVLPRAIMLVIVGAATFALIWAFFGKIDVVAIAPGKVIAADKTKIIQPAETAVVKRILVTDGQLVKAGQVLIELDAAATATVAETARVREALLAARLEAARHEALAKAAGGSVAAVLVAPSPAPEALVVSETRAMHSQYAEHRSRLASLDAEILKRRAELSATERLVTKFIQTVPIAQRRANDYKSLVEQKFVSEHGYLEREQARIEQEGELDFQRSKATELGHAITEAQSRRASLVAEFERIAVGAKVDADKRASLLEQELIKARTRQEQQTLVAPVDGTVQQLAVHTIGGVVTPAQTLMVITPVEYQAEVEALLENKDVGFVKVGQRAEVKVETFPFTRYGTLSGVVSFVSSDAVADEKRGLIFQARVKLDKATMWIDERQVAMSPGMAVTAEIATDRRRLIDFFLDPIRKTTGEGLRER